MGDAVTYECFTGATTPCICNSVIGEVLVYKQKTDNDKDLSVSNYSVSYLLGQIFRSTE